MHARAMARLRAARLGWATTLALSLLLLSGVGSALGHEDDDGSGKSADLVRQAIALIVNTPGDLDAIRDKVDDAGKAQDTSGVELAMVARARSAFDAGDLHQARALLEQSIGAQPHLDVNATEPAPIRETTPTTAETSDGPMGMPNEPVPAASPMTMATGDEPGAALIAEPLGTRPHLDGEDWALLAGSITLGMAGVWLGLRYRPHRAKAA